METCICLLYLIEHHADYGVLKCSFLHDTLQSDKMLTGPVVLEIEIMLKLISNIGCAAAHSFIRALGY